MSTSAPAGTVTQPRRSHNVCSTQLFPDTGVEAVSVAVSTVPAVMTSVPTAPADVRAIATTDSTYPEIVGVRIVGDVLKTTATVPVLEATPVPPLATGNAVVKLRLNALTARPAVKLATETCLVVVLWTIGKTSVPARGVVLAGRALIFESAIFHSFDVMIHERRMGR